MSGSSTSWEGGEASGGAVSVARAEEERTDEQIDLFQMKPLL